MIEMTAGQWAVVIIFAVFLTLLAILWLVLGDAWCGNTAPKAASALDAAELRLDVANGHAEATDRLVVEQAEQLRAAEARIAELERKLAEAYRNWEQHEAEDHDIAEAIRRGSDEVMKWALGPETFGRLWGPELERLGGVIDRLRDIETKAKALVAAHDFASCCHPSVYEELRAALTPKAEG